MSESEAVPFSESDIADGRTRTQRSTTYLTDTSVKSREEVAERIWKTVLSAAIPIVAIIVVIDFIPYASYMQLLAVLMICIFGQSTFRLLFIILKAENMYRIHSVSKKIANWTTMSVTYKIGEWKYQSIHSISELSAIKGTDTVTSVVCMSENIWVLCITIVIYRMNYAEKNPDFYNLNFDDLLMLIGVFGLLVRGIWDLNPWSTSQKIIHYSGTICWFAVIVAYGYQTNWNYGFFILSALAMVFFMIWTGISINANAYDGENEKKVNLNSKLMLVSEICMLWQGIIALELWVYYNDHYNENQY